MCYGSDNPPFFLSIGDMIDALMDQVRDQVNTAEHIQHSGSLGVGTEEFE